MSQTPSPSYIRGISSSFTTDIIGTSSFAVINWNLGDSDWLYGCTDLHVLHQQEVDRCKKIRNFRKTATTADVIAPLVRILESFEMPKLVYLSANGDTALDEIEEIESALISNQFDVLTTADLGEYLNYHFGDCQVL